MNEFEKNLNNLLVDTFNYILKYEELALQQILSVPVTITEAHMIEAVGRNGDDEMTVGRIASSLNIAMPTATVAIKKLEKKGFINKVHCENDGRRAIVNLTETGKKIEKAHRLFHERMVRNISRQYAVDEKEVLLKSIKTLREFFKEKVET